MDTPLTRKSFGKLIFGGTFSRSTVICLLREDEPLTVASCRLSLACIAVFISLYQYTKNQKRQCEKKETGRAKGSGREH